MRNNVNDEKMMKDDTGIHSHHVNTNIDITSRGTSHKALTLDKDITRCDMAYQ